MGEYHWVTGGETNIVHLAWIGSGGSGSVYKRGVKMINKATDETFARKLIQRSANMAEEDTLNEIKAINRLSPWRHRNVVNILNHSRLNDLPFYAIDMELCDFSLADYINQDKEALRIIGDNTGRNEIWRWYTIAIIMKDISEGLGFLHDLKQIHRDLKPSNVLYSSKTSAWKIADFGFTTENSSDSVAISNFARGSTGYRAPELLQNPPKFTPRVDIWALGCIYHELVTGKKAFLDDWEVKEYGNGRRNLDIPDADKHMRESKGHYKAAYQMLNVNYLRRPSAKFFIWFFAELCDQFEPESPHEGSFSVAENGYGFYDEWQCEKCRTKARNVLKSLSRMLISSANSLAKDFHASTVKIWESDSVLSYLQCGVLQLHSIHAVEPISS